MLQIGIYFTQSKTLRNNIIDKLWGLLDTCLTDTVCCNIKYITDVKRCASGNELCMHTTGGCINYTEVCNHVLFLIPTYYNKEYIANMVFLKHILCIPGARVTMDTDIENSISVHINRKMTKFY